MTITTRGAAAPTSAGADREGFSSDALDEAVERVAGRVDAWAATTPTERARLLGEVIDSTVAAADAWLAAACRAKGLDPKAVDGGEELFSGIGTFLRMARTFKVSIEDIARVGRPEFPGPVRESKDGRLVVQVFPADTFDKILYAKTTGEVWIEPGITRAELESSQAPAYKDPEAWKGLSLVLGAGNVASLGPRDVLTKLFVEGKVVVLKANPVNDYLVPHWTAAMKPLIDAGYLAIVEGGAEAGKHLCGHELVDEIHVTGSDKTHDAIVFGVGAEGAERKAAVDPLITKPVTCELGNVSPVVIVPGDWSDKDIAYQAEHVATMLVNNAGFNCLTPRVLVTHRDWPQRREFLDALENVLARVPTRLAYYPGAFTRRDLFVSAHPEAHSIGSSEEGAIAWTVIRDVDPAHRDDVCFNVEAFCALIAETALDAATPEEFVAHAVDFCNDVVRGTLSMTLLIDPRSRRRPAMRAALEKALDDLRYGCIGLNVWHALGILIGSVPWGAYPGHVATDIQSGVGTVGNTYMFARPQKSVVRGPFVAWPKPAWFVTHRRSTKTLRRIFEVQCSQSWANVPAALWSALRP